MNNRAAYLVSRKLTLEISESEIQELNLLLMQDPDLYETISLIEGAWNTRHSTNEQADIERLIKKLQQVEPGFFHFDHETLTSPKISSNRSFSFTRVWQAVAAAVVIMFGLWWFLGKNNEQLPENTMESPLNLVATKAGNRTHVVLRDGTKVWLNGDSKLTYANVFNGETREVRLSGEAYFEVIPNPKSPFIIHTEKTTVKVTGTTLNVRDYPGEEKAETSLLTGKAEVVDRTNPSRVFFLKPNQKVVFSRHEEITGKKDLKAPGMAKVLTTYQPKILDLTYYPNDTIPVATAWVSDQLVFSDESFRDVADKMEKWYNVTIEIRSARLAEARLNGKFENESLPMALQALQFSTPFQYQINGNKVIIDKN